MTIDDAVKMMGVLDAQCDGSPQSVMRRDRLNEVLLKTPEQFWDTFWDEMWNSEPKDAIRQQAERLLRSGAVNEETTIADIPALVAWDEMTQRRRQS